MRIWVSGKNISSRRDKKVSEESAEALKAKR